MRWPCRYVGHEMKTWVWIILTVFLAIGVGAAVGLLGGWSGYHQRNFVVTIVSIGLILSIFSAGWMFNHVLKVRDAFGPRFLFPLAFVVFYGGPFLDWVDFSDVMPSPGITMALLALLGLVSYLTGVWLARSCWSTENVEWPRIEPRHWRGPAMWLVLIGISLASLGILAFSFRRAGMIPLLTDDVQWARFVFASTIGNVLNTATRFTIPAAIGLGLFLFVSRRKVGVLNAIAFTFLISLIIGALLLGHRGLLVMILAPLFVCFHYLVRQVKPAPLAILGSLALVGLGVANYFRFAGSPERLANELSRSNLPAWMPEWFYFVVVLVVFSPLTFNFVLSMMPDIVSFQYGAALFNGAFGILPGHQPTVGGFVSRILFGLPEGAPDLPPTILGGLYLDFGAGGIVVGMLLVGMVTQYLYWRMFARPSVWSTFLYVYWFSNLFVALYGDLIANSFTWLLPLIVYLISFVARWLSYLLRPSSGRSLSILRSMESRGVRT